MRSPARNLRTAVRTSGYLAIAGVVLFAGIGVTHLVSAAGPVKVDSTSYQAGAPIRVSTSKANIFWGQGTSLDVSTVVCTSRNLDGNYPAVLPAGTPQGSESLAAITDPELGELVYLASSAEPRFRNDLVTCEGPGLETVRLSQDLQTPLERGAAIGFLVAAGVAALWGFVTLRITRPRAVGGSPDRVAA
ncbi:hypothetical protein [Pengzhenrongella frigida]|uniref:Uncharacterized protein n=1 Tax=Pengzhenrongella frigida TaxID=1259133 RepID=A0A4Q5N284_9MICO|nr:hypothetical protein [Cellulomonas sp. HLT2-17]RYV52215.1 hypothetical protein EUA98_04395 [Cellulomonas sp. HLT2-17]